MVSAYLDNQRNWGERNGGVSDPRLVAQVNRIHPRPNTTAELDAARRQVHTHSRGRRELATFFAMIFPPLLEAA